jgi:hypothetical protein
MTHAESPYGAPNNAPADGLPGGFPPHVGYGSPPAPGYDGTQAPAGYPGAYGTPGPPVAPGAPAAAPAGSPPGYQPPPPGYQPPPPGYQPPADPRGPAVPPARRGYRPFGAEDVQHDRAQQEIDRSEAVRRGNRDMVMGGIWLGGGLLLTLITYASSSPVAIVAWGPMLYGIFRLGKGILTVQRNRG